MIYLSDEAMKADEHTNGEHDAIDIDCYACRADARELGIRIPLPDFGVDVGLPSNGDIDR